jgi:hypothetical protein
MKTWGADPTIQEIRTRLRILKRDCNSPYAVEDFSRGYRHGIDEALNEIRKVMKNVAMRKKKDVLGTVKRVVASYKQITRFANKG